MGVMPGAAPGGRPGRRPGAGGQGPRREGAAPCRRAGGRDGPGRWRCAAGAGPCGPGGRACGGSRGSCLAQDDLEPGALALLLELLDAASADVALAEVDAFEELLDVLSGGPAGNLDDIGLVDAEARVRQAIGQVAVVGEQQQALAIFVEPADGVDALGDVRHEVDGPGTASGVVV